MHDSGDNYLDTRRHAELLRYVQTDLRWDASWIERPVEGNAGKTGRKTVIHISCEKKAAAQLLPRDAMVRLYPRFQPGTGGVGQDGWPLAGQDVLRISFQPNLTCLDERSCGMEVESPLALFKGMIKDWNKKNPRSESLPEIRNIAKLVVVIEPSWQIDSREILEGVARHEEEIDPPLEWKK